MRRLAQTIRLRPERRERYLCTATCGLGLRPRCARRASVTTASSCGETRCSATSSTTATTSRPTWRVITVDRKVVEVAGHLYVEAPKNRKYRRTIYPRRTPGGYPLADELAARTEDARVEQAAGANPLGLLFPSPAGASSRIGQPRASRSFFICRPK